MSEDLLLRIENMEKRIRELEIALNKAQQWQAELEQVLKKSSDSTLRNHLELWLYYRDHR